MIFNCLAMSSSGWKIEWNATEIRTDVAGLSCKRWISGWGCPKSNSSGRNACRVGGQRFPRMPVAPWQPRRNGWWHAWRNLWAFFHACNF